MGRISRAASRPAMLGTGLAIVVHCAAALPSYTTSAIMSIRPTLFKQRPFNPLTDFVPISNYVKSPFVFIINPSLPVKSVAELVAKLRDEAGVI